MTAAEAGAADEELRRLTRRAATATRRALEHAAQ